MIMQAVESQAVESGERSRLSAGQVQRVVSEAARLYFESRRSRLNAFVERHFSLAGSLALHRKALGLGCDQGTTEHRSRRPVYRRQADREAPDRSVP